MWWVAAKVLASVWFLSVGLAFASYPINFEESLKAYKAWQVQELERARRFLSKQQIEEAEAALQSGLTRPFGLYGLSCYLQGAKCEILDRRGKVVLDMPFKPAVFRGMTDVRPVGKKWEEPLEVRGELVFVGYGLEHEDRSWSFYGNILARGKIAVLVLDVPTAFEEGLANLDKPDLVVRAASKHAASAVIAVGPREFPSGTCSMDGPPTIFVGESWGRRLLAQAGVDLDEFRKQMVSLADIAAPRKLGLSARITIAGVEYQQRESEHFFIRYRPNSDVGRTVGDLVARREDAFSRLVALFDTDYPYKVRYIVYPNAEEKAFLSNHIGAGYSHSRVIGEDHGERPGEEKIDDYHEITHLISALIGSPPAVLNEGLAWLLGETKARLEPIRNGEMLVVDAVSARNLQKGVLWPVKELITFEEIGNPPTKPWIAYPQSASIVAYIIRSYGWSKLMELFREVRGTSIANKAFEQVTGTSIGEFESKWLAYLRSLPEDQSKSGEP